MKASATTAAARCRSRSCSRASPWATRRRAAMPRCRPAWPGRRATTEPERLSDRARRCVGQERVALELEVFADPERALERDQERAGQPAPQRRAPAAIEEATVGEQQQRDAGHQDDRRGGPFADPARPPPAAGQRVDEVRVDRVLGARARQHGAQSRRARIQPSGWRGQVGEHERAQHQQQAPPGIGRARGRRWDDRARHPGSFYEHEQHERARDEQRRPDGDHRRRRALAGSRRRDAGAWPSSASEALLIARRSRPRAP